MQRFKTAGRTDTQRIGRQLAAHLKPGHVVALFGELGAGKTAFVSGLAQGLGYNGEVTSPTFALLHEYTGGRLPLYHFDMYRVTGAEDLYSTGFFDYLDEPGVLAIEWSENIRDALPENAVVVRISRGTNDNIRIIEIEGIDYADTGH